MSARERNRYVTATIVFVLAFALISVLVARSAAQIVITIRPQGFSSGTYDGQDTIDCSTPVLDISATVSPTLAFDQNPNTEAITYSDADFFPDTSVDDDFSVSGTWSVFNQESTCLASTYLYVMRDAINNSELDSLRQWKIEYTIDPGSEWHEMARFTIVYKDETGTPPVEGDKVLNRDKGGEAGFVKEVQAGKTLVLERYWPGEFEHWIPEEDIETVDSSFSAKIDSFSIEHNPQPESDTDKTLGPVWLVDQPVEDFLDSNLRVRTRTRQRGCIDECPLCDGNPLARLNIFEIFTKSPWDEDNCGLCPLEIITPTVLPDANIYEDYDEVIEADCGFPPYEWDVTPVNTPPEFLFELLPGASPYDLRITYDSTGTLSVPGEYTLTVQVTDYSLIPQVDVRQFTLLVRGLAISPCGDLDPAVKGMSYKFPGGLQFKPLGPPGAEYYWCWSGEIPPGMKLRKSGGGTVPTCPGSGIPELEPGYREDSYLVLYDTPINDGMYSFTLKLRNEDEVTECQYTLEVSAAGVTLQPKKLKGYIQDVDYGFDADKMRPDFIIATGIDNAGAAGDIYIMPYVAPPSMNINLPLSLNGFYLSPGGNDVLPSDNPLPYPPYHRGGVFRTNIVGKFSINNEETGNHPFRVGIDDPGNVKAAGDWTEYLLPILERKTVIVKAPPSAVALPYTSEQDKRYKLEFTVFGEGGAPSTAVGTDVDVSTRTAFYNYRWTVTPVYGTNSPALKSNYADSQVDFFGGTSPNKAKPDKISIRFADINDQPVIGTYDVTFWAQDVLRRKFSGDDDYEFTSATVRLKIIAPAGRTLERDAERPMKHRQERFE